MKIGCEPTNTRQAAILLLITPLHRSRGAFGVEDNSGEQSVTALQQQSTLGLSQTC